MKYKTKMLLIISTINFILNRKSVFALLLCLEIIMMGLIILYNKTDIYITMIIIILAGIESLIALALLINYYRC